MGNQATRLSRDARRRPAAAAAAAGARVCIYVAAAPEAVCVRLECARDLAAAAAQRGAHPQLRQPEHALGWEKGGRRRGRRLSGIRFINGCKGVAKEQNVHGGDGRARCSTQAAARQTVSGAEGEGPWHSSGAAAPRRLCPSAARTLPRMSFSCTTSVARSARSFSRDSTVERSSLISWTTWGSNLNGGFKIQTAGGGGARVSGRPHRRGRQALGQGRPRSLQAAGRHRAGVAREKAQALITECVRSLEGPRSRSPLWRA